MIRLFTSFSAVGLFCTAFSLLMIFALDTLTDLNASSAYIFSYASSITLSYLLNAKLFQSSYALHSFILYIGIYLSSMVLGIGLIQILAQNLPWQNWAISFLTVPATMSWNFLLSHFLFK